MNYCRVIVCFIYLCGFNVLKGQNDLGSLKVGDKAPLLSIIKWINGDSIAHFEEGKMYVVEFSGTWCAPCRKAIPHLTKLARKYAGQIPFISVYCEKNNKQDTVDLSYIKKVIDLKEQLGNRMDFAIAVDVPKQITKDSWRVSSFPTAFVIDKSGEIFWIGHPDDLGNVLSEMLKGTFDAGADAKKKIKFKKMIEAIGKMEDEGKYSRALLQIDSLITDHPEVNFLYSVKFRILTRNDAKAAYLLLETLLNKEIKDFIWPISYFNKISPGSRNYEIELKVIDKAIEQSETEYHKAFPLAEKASVFAMMGDYSSAVKTVKLAIEKLNYYGDTAISWAEKTYKLSSCIYEYRDLLKDNEAKAEAWLLSILVNEKASDYYSLIDIFLGLPDPDYEFSLQLLSIAKARADDKQLARWLLLKEMDIYTLQGNYANAIESCKQALAISKVGRVKSYIERDEKKLVELKEKAKKR